MFLQSLENTLLPVELGSCCNLSNHHQWRLKALGSCDGIEG